MAPEGEGKDFLCKVKMTSNLNLQQELPNEAMITD